ncbi:MAG: GNAT family N-acetyltransferase [Coriobacteriales bacterium]|jgi:N-acetylglutamate synthase-like GNAT family acetyltransferase|nr:GNAT family N-acetyltransferase [Coriobacteriales bacterium]
MIEKDNVASHSKTQIKIRKAEEKDIPEICRMLTARVVDSVEQSYILDGICDKEKLTNLLLNIQINDVYRVGEIWIAGDYQGVLTGHYGKGFTTLSLLRTAVAQNRQLIKHMTKTDLSQLKINMKRMAGTVNMRWRKQICGSADYFYLQLIAIDRSLKGSGTFRQLVGPILERSEHENIPVLLDTHDKDNIPLYEHFGFELVKEHRARSGAPIVQYSMIRRC